MSHEIDRVIPTDEITKQDLYPKGDIQKLHRNLFPKGNRQDLNQTDRDEQTRNISRRNLIKYLPPLAAIGISVASIARQIAKEENQESQPTVNPIYLPSLPNAYLEGWTLIDFSANHQIDTSAFEDRPFDPTQIDFFNRFSDVDIDRLIIVQNPFIDVRTDNLGNESRWLTLITYDDSTSQEFLTGGGYRGIYINTEPDREFDSVFYMGSTHSIEESTPEEVAYHPDHTFIRSNDHKDISGNTIGLILPQYSKSLDDIMKRNLRLIEEQKDNQ